MNPLPSTADRQTLDWGRTAYEAAWKQQLALVEQRNAGEVGDTLIFTEHDPVYTLGVRKDSAGHLIWNADELQRRGIALIQTNRGGDITYHGPGQIVGYPIVSLAPRKDLHAYLRLLEQILINTVGTFGLAADRRVGKTGIWLGSRKIAAIGVAVKKWVDLSRLRPQRKSRPRAASVASSLAALPMAPSLPCKLNSGIPWICPK